jgi:hypothetical protein
MNSSPRIRRLKIIAQDPSITDENGKILTTDVDIPAEDFAPGPSGYRVQVIDYDSSTGTHYMPLAYPPLKNGAYRDPFDEKKIRNNDDILEDPNFHAQNVYAIIMRTLARFEFALGRRIGWGFDGHQINVAPHAFADANAFYSDRDRALMFGYFRSPLTGKEIFSCLSHDVVAHETTHAILDGLRKRYTAPSSPEQAGFHEGFADIVALLSVFSLRKIVEFLLKKSENSDSQKSKKNSISDSQAEDAAAKNPPASDNPNLISFEVLEKSKLKNSILLGLAEQMGEEMSGVRGRALRRSLMLEPLPKDADPYLKQTAFEEPHRCGELLVAALLNAFIEVWDQRIRLLKEQQDVKNKFLSLNLVVENGAEAAEHLLTMAIRALDYTPPTDIKFGDYLSAILTADKETVPDDTKYNYRKQITESFKAYGIEPASGEADGAWQPTDEEFKYDRTHFESLMREPTEVFRFIWDNRAKLKIDDRAYTRVQSVRPCLRISPDGFALRETVVEYVQMTKVRADELQQLFPPIGKPNRMPKDTEVTLYGGGTLIFDEYGRIKYHIANNIFSQALQADRIDYLWRYGYFPETNSRENLFARMHLNRSAVFSNHFVEEEF